MQCKHGLRITLLATALVLPTVSPAFAQHACSNKTLSGGYGFLVNGVNEGLGVQFAIAGFFSPDGNGRFTGQATKDSSGTISHTKFDGTYSVAVDCSGTAQFVFQNQAKSTIDFFLVNNGNEIYLIVADNGTVETGTAKRQFSVR